MKLAEYADSRNKSVDEVKQALASVGQSTHPNRNVDETQLDAYFNGTPPPSDPPAHQQPPEPDPVERIVTESDPNSDPQGAKAEAQKILASKSTFVNTDAATEDRVIYGTYERGMSLFELRAQGVKNPFGTRTFLAYGFDSSQAIANVLKRFNGVNSENITWGGTQKPIAQGLQG